MIKNVLGFVLLLTSLTAFSQYSDSTTHFASFVSSGSVNKADGTSAYLLNNAVRLGLKRKDISLNFTNTWIYGKQNTSITNNDFSSTLDFNLYKTFPHFFYWGLANYNTSYSLKITNQLLTGAGIAYSILDLPNTYLNISDGILYDYSDLILTDSSQDKYSTSRNSLRLSYKFLIGKLIQINGSNFIQNSFNDRHDYIIRSNNRLNFKINKWVNIMTQFEYNKMNRTAKENLLLSYGLSFERYF
jgi:hypothetical protein